MADLKINLTKQYTTRDGKQVKLYEILDGRVFGLFKFQGKWTAAEWTMEGRYWTLRELDLVEVKPAYWVNLYKGRTSSWHESRDNADAFFTGLNAAAQQDRIACLHFTEGDGLD